MGERPLHPSLELRLEEVTEKMSKSRGNVVHPQDVIEKYSSDALRFWAAGVKLGEDLGLCQGLGRGPRLLTTDGGRWPALGQSDGVLIDVKADQAAALAQAQGAQQLAARLAQRDTSIPVVLNTAYSSYKDNYLTWSADKYVTKSADVTELLEAVHEVLEARMATGQ